MKKTKWILAFLVMSFISFYLWWQFFAPRTLTITTPTNVVQLKVERALTQSQQQKGLMYRTHLDKNKGMIFLFNPNRVAYMWMKNTLIPLDMVFFNNEGEVVAIHRNAIPQDLSLISSIIPVAGVLEINAGAVDEFGITLGSKLDLSTFF